MKYRNDNLLLYIALADAYSAAAEFLKLPQEAHVRSQLLKFEGYLSHPRFRNPPGSYTDDTEMSVANARVLVENDLPYTPLMFADAYVREFARGNKRKGYAPGFQSFLESISSGQEFLDKIKPYSTKNGAAMRAVPIGALPTVEEVLEIAKLQAEITHNTEEGIFSAQAVALMGHYALYEQGPLSMVGQYCLDVLPRELADTFAHVFTSPWSEQPVTGDAARSIAETTVHAVVHLLTHCQSLLTILAEAINWGGDVDSVAAITGGVASCRYRDENLPPFMVSGLEGGNSKTGQTYLCTIGSQLMSKFAQRIVCIESAEQWTGVANIQGHVVVPRELDLASIEEQWFKGGGDSSGHSFYQYLIHLGYPPVAIEPWYISYQ